MQFSMKYNFNQTENNTGANLIIYYDKISVCVYMYFLEQLFCLKIQIFHKMSTKPFFEINKINKTESSGKFHVSLTEYISN